MQWTFGDSTTIWPDYCREVILVKPALDNTEEDWNRVFDINLKGTWFMCQTVLRHMVREKIQGSIINISSADSHRTQPDMTVYFSSKAGINHLTRSSELRNGTLPYRINTLAPGGRLTSMVKEFLQTPYGQNAVWIVPFRRLANLDELDGALLLLKCRERRPLAVARGSVMNVKVRQ